MDDFELEIKRDFLVEAKDILLKAESSFLNLETSSTPLELLDQNFTLSS